MSEQPSVILTVEKDDPNTLWEHRQLQFARLINEMEQAGVFTDGAIDGLAERMDLERADVCQILEHAQDQWDKAKAGNAPALTMNGDTTEDYTLLKSHPGVWIGIENIAVRLVRTDECVVVDLYPNGDEMEGPIASTYASFAEAEPIEEDEG